MSHLRSQLKMNTASRPTSDKQGSEAALGKAKDTLSKLVRSTAVTSVLGKIPQAQAIGSLYEFKDSVMKLQSITLNTEDYEKEVKMLRAVFENTCDVISTIYDEEGFSESAVSFGPIVYDKPGDFYPGVTPFSKYGGHATINIRSKKKTEQIEGDEEASVFYDKGNGLQFIRFGNEVVRLSKGIAAGGEVKFAYGWVDMDTPSGIPLQLVIGVARDPIMLTCLRVSNMAASKKFFCDDLGMSVYPMPLARQPGSQYEPEPIKDSVFVSYGPDELGILLVPAEKGKQVRVGSLLHHMTIIVDDAQKDKLPAVAQAYLESGANEVSSPDGYRFQFNSYSAFKKSCTTKK